jgi:hypothetical protein
MRMSKVLGDGIPHPAVNVAGDVVKVLFRATSKPRCISWEVIDVLFGVVHALFGIVLDAVFVFLEAILVPIVIVPYIHS